MNTLASLGAASRWRTIAVLGTGVILAGLALGFARFVHLAGKPTDLPPHADGIVAFTGGPERVETALRLLAQGRADRLLLSGIGGGAELPELARLAGVSPMPIAPRVTIGRNATTTRGNALETTAWAHANGIHTLFVVTAFYHMPRAIAELSRALPEVTLYPVPVGFPSAGHWFGAPLRLVAEEYAKYLASVTGLTSVLPTREAAAVHGGHLG